MRWFLTNASPLADTLTAAGEVVVSTPATHQTGGRHGEWLRELISATEHNRPAGRDPVSWALDTGIQDEDDRNPGDYPIAKFLRAATPDVLVLTPLDQRGCGFQRGGVNRWKNRMLKRGAVVGIADDPATIQRAQGRVWRQCSARVGDLGVYVTNHEPTAVRLAKEMRTALWAPGESVSGIVAAVVHARTQNYRAGSRDAKFFSNR